MFKQERKLLTLYPPTLNPKVKGYGDLGLIFCCFFFPYDVCYQQIMWC